MESGREKQTLPEWQTRAGERGNKRVLANGPRRRFSCPRQWCDWLREHSCIATSRARMILEETELQLRQTSGCDWRQLAPGSLPLFQCSTLVNSSVFIGRAKLPPSERIRSFD